VVLLSGVVPSRVLLRATSVQKGPWKSHTLRGKTPCAVTGSTRNDTVCTMAAPRNVDLRRRPILLLLAPALAPRTWRREGAAEGAPRRLYKRTGPGEQVIEEKTHEKQEAKESRKKRSGPCNRREFDVHGRPRTPQRRPIASPFHVHFKCAAAKPRAASRAGLPSFNGRCLHGQHFKRCLNSCMYTAKGCSGKAWW